MEPGTIRVVGFAGSLRSGSFNRALVRAAQRLAPPDMVVEIVDLHEIPLFDADVEAQGDPPAVRSLKERISEADALLISTPEYQYGVPGVLKNAIDWASRPPGESPMQAKPVAIMGATPGLWGTARAQQQLRQALLFNACPTVLEPEVLVAEVSDKVDDEGEIDDEQTLGFVSKLLESLARLARLHGSETKADH